MGNGGNPFRGTWPRYRDWLERRTWAEGSLPRHIGCMGVMKYCGLCEGWMLI